jgi:hypothetical protein
MQYFTSEAAVEDAKSDIQAHVLIEIGVRDIYY